MIEQRTHPSPGILAGVKSAALLVISLVLFSCQSTTPKEELFSPRSTQAHRASSYDLNWETGNKDARPLPAGETLEIANLDGPGVIRHIWFTVGGGGHFYPRSLVLRIYWDGASEPSVESPLGDFFAIGHGLRRSHNSAMISTSADGRSYNCYWPMPFRKNARITVTNDGTRDVWGLYYYVDYETETNLSADTPYFHAQYRQASPPAEDERYLICDTKGKGHYVGTVLSCQNRQASWFGEGDDFFFIDDDQTTPTLKGTGTEDYFGDSWGFREFNHLYHGISLYDEGSMGNRTTAYRWHTPFPIPFEKSLRFEIEHTGVRQKPDGSMGTYGTRPDDFSSVAFWYQTGKATNFATLPPVEERIPEHIIVRAKQLFEQANKLEEEKPLDVTLKKWALQADFTEPGDQVTLPVVSPGEGRYRIAILLKHNRWSGVIDVALENHTRQKINTYRPHPVINEYNLGVIDLKKDEVVKITFTEAGVEEKTFLKETGLPDNSLGIDGIIFYPIEYRTYDTP